jgi:polyisoprenyl-phosphate glycosyltransferase
VGRRAHRRRLRAPAWVVNGDFPGLLFLGGLVLGVLAVQGFILALVGEYLGRIQRDVEGRPLYTIDEELQ